MSCTTLETEAGTPARREKDGLPASVSRVLFDLGKLLAPWGFEDEAGFHYGSPGDDESEPHQVHV